MTDISRPPMASRQQPYGIGEALSDAQPAEHQIVEMGDGSLQHYVAPGTLNDQLGSSRVPLTTARSEGTAASADARNWNSRGSENEPGLRNKPGI